VVRRDAALDRRPVAHRAFHRRAVAAVEAPRIHVRRLGLSGSIRRAFVDVLARVVRFCRLRPILRLRIAGCRADRARRVEPTGGASRGVFRLRATLSRRNRDCRVISAICLLRRQLEIHSRREGRRRDVRMVPRERTAGRATDLQPGLYVDSIRPRSMGTPPLHRRPRT